MKTIFKKGDKVWSFSRQECGIVDTVEDKRDHNYPVAVRFEEAGNKLTYTADGKAWDCYIEPDLYLHKVIARPLEETSTQTPIIL